MNKSPQGKDKNREMGCEEISNKNALKDEGLMVDS